jgi:hypothetical protein
MEKGTLRADVNISVRRRHRPAHSPPLEGGGRRLPLLPRPRSRRGRTTGRARRTAARRASRAAGGAHPPTPVLRRVRPGRRTRRDGQGPGYGAALAWV